MALDSTEVGMDSEQLSTDLQLNDLHNTDTQAALRLTVDGERGRRLRLAHHVLRHARVGAHIGRGQTADLQGVVLADLVPRSKQALGRLKTDNAGRRGQTWSGQRPGRGRTVEASA